MTHTNFAPLRTNRAATALVLAVLTLGCTLASAQTAPQDQTPPPNDQTQPGGDHRPPQAAFDACKSQAAGAVCNFTGDRGKVEGTCWAPQGKPLACKPTNTSPPNDASPPPAQQ